MSSVTWRIECTDGKKDAIALSVGKTVIGRGHLLQIRELKVSRHHAEVQITEEGEFVLKAMHPGLPCFYKRNDEEKRNELLRGATVSLHDGDIFSLHANPDCEFKVMQGAAEDKTGEEAGGDSKKETVKEKSEPEEDDGDVEEEEEESEEKEDEGSDWSDTKKRPAAKRKPPTRRADSEEEDEGSDYSEEKPKSRTGRTKKKKKLPAKKAPPSRNSRRVAPKRRKVASSEEEELSEENSDESNSDYGGRRSRRQPARVQQRLPARRATKPVSYNEDLMLGGMSASESEHESEDGLPKIGRQKKPDSDSDFKVDEDSGSDWEEGSKSKKGSRRSGPPPKISSRKGRRRKNSDSSDEEPEYIPRATKRRGTAVERSKCKFGEECYRKNKDHKEEYIHPGDSDWSDSSQGEEEKENGSEKGSEKGSAEESE